MNADSLKTVADTLFQAKASSAAWGWANVTANHGLSITWSGLLVVFLGLSLIALTISAFNGVSLLAQKWKALKEEKEDAVVKEPATDGPTIPEDHLIAITTAVELYRRLHLDPIRTKVTFVRGEMHTPWKTGFKYGQRIVPGKKS